MKKFILFILFIIMANMAFSVTLTVIVMPFKISDNAVTEDEATQIADSITKSLLDRGVSIVDRDSLADILEELQFQSSDWSNPQKTAELGKILNAHIIIKGRISEHNATGYTYIGNAIAGTYSIRYHISISAINIKTAQVIGSESFYWEAIHSRFLDNNVRKFYNAVSIESFASPDRIGKSQYKKGFGFLECVYLGKANFKTAQKIAKEYKNGDFDNWHLITLHEFRDLDWAFEDSGKAWSIEKGKPCIINWGYNLWGYKVSSITTDQDPNEEFDVYVAH